MCSLENNFLEDEGVQHLAAALKVNKTLTTIHLEGNRISFEGAKHLAEALKDNATLKELKCAAARPA